MDHGAGLMFRGLSVFALIPARGGSKGIPGKNLREVGGMSLIARCANIARSVPQLDDVILSTDDPQIAAEGRNAGLSVPFMRPDELASDEAKSIDVWRHAWAEAEAAAGKRYDLSVLLEPTSPLRRPQDVIQTLERLLDGGSRAAATVSRTPSSFTPHKTLTVGDNGQIGFYVADGAKFTRRQDIPSYYYRNGICYAALRETVVERGTLVEDDCAAVIIDRPIANIDEPLDLDIAEMLLAREASGP